MKKKIGFIVGLMIGLGAFAQSFSIDSTFQPFFRIDNQADPSCGRLIENDVGKLFIGGQFRLTLPPGNKNYNSLISTHRDGSRNQLFNNGGGGSNILSISDSSFAIGSLGYVLIDTNGNRINQDWFLNAIKTARCWNVVTPYFYPDGSSLFSKGTDNTAQPCSIINPPDTFHGRHIVKLTPEGLWDSSFVGIANSIVRGFVPYDSTRILIYGVPNQFTHYNGVTVDGMCRVFLDGRLDTTFHSPFDPNVQFSFPGVLEVEEDGKIFIGGFFHLKNHLDQETLVRLNPDGSLDTTFLNFGSPERIGGSVTVTTIEKTVDKGYLVGGGFDRYQGFDRTSIAKIDSTGKVDPRFFNSGGPDSSAQFGVGNASVSTILKSKFGGYYVTGNFLRWDGKPTQPIVRIHGMAVGLKEEKQQLPQVSIFPNPSKSVFQINTSASIEQLEVYDLVGKKVKVQQKQTNIDLSGLEKGVYLIQLHFKNGTQVTRKVMKQ